MDVTKILTDLRRNREHIDEAILSLERLAQSKRHRGRPPRWFRKPPGDPDEGSGGTPGEGCAGVPNPLLPRRPPKTSRAGAALRLDSKLADAVATPRRKLPPNSADAA
jgi:hypothetical protein